MKKAIELPDRKEVKAVGLAIEKIAGALEILDTSSCSRGGEVEQNLSEAIDILRSVVNEQKPCWETPEQWKKRTGKAWAKNGAVYAKFEELDFKGGLGHVIKKWGEWDLKTLRMARHTQKLCKNSFGVDEWSCRSVIVCATEAGPPPDDWRPEEGK
jgi:hypothetical protein